MEIKGKRVLITGANRGLGRALAIACAQAGAKEVLAGARRPESIDPFTDSGNRITTIRLDVRNQDEVEAAVKLGPIDILINNAGIAVFGGLLKMGIEDIRNELEINYFGVLNMTRAFVSAMIENGGGLIVNISSILGRISLPIVGSYCVTKAAVLMLTDVLRAELKEQGINVIAVLPATVETDMSRDVEGPRMSAEEAAVEILEAIRNEPNEIPIGDQAREMYAGI